MLTLDEQISQVEVCLDVIRGVEILGVQPVYVISLLEREYEVLVIRLEESERGALAS